MMCLKETLFAFILFRFYWASWICIVWSFNKFRGFFRHCLPKYFSVLTFFCSFGTPVTRMWELFVIVSWNCSFCNLFSLWCLNWVIYIGFPLIYILILNHLLSFFFKKSWILYFSILKFSLDFFYVFHCLDFLVSHLFQEYVHSYLWDTFCDSCFKSFVR